MTTTRSLSQWLSFFATTLSFSGAALAQFTSTAPTLTAAKPSYKVYGTGSQYDTVNGDITAAPTLPPLSTGIKLEGGVLTITGSNYDDGASVVPSGTDVVASRGSFKSTFPASSVSRIVFYGNGGNDSFSNTTNIKSEAYGGDGNDSLRGGSNADFLVGGLGNDSLYGNNGDDVLWGSGGHDALDGGNDDDHLKGHGGDDYLYGQYGEDALYGGTGTDELSGGYGIDTLVSIGGGTDTVVGGTSNDFFWVDTVDEVVSATTTELDGGYVNRVGSFYRYSFDGGITSTAVAKDLTNYNLADPTPHNSNDVLVNYGAEPLFASSGIDVTDVIQGGADDCFILGPLGAVAMQTPDSIRKLVVDLDDGTYVVRFYRTPLGSAEFVRVDADLYESSPGNLRYARLATGRALWVPIVEKAFAFFRDREGSYPSIDGGNSGLEGATAMHASKEQYSIPEFVTASDVVEWIAAGRPSGWVKDYINSTTTALLNHIADRLAEGRPVYTGFTPNSVNTTTLTTSNWRRGTHIITITDVQFDSNGNPTALVIRDQVDDDEFVFTDFARIFHLFGRAHTYDMP